MTSRRPDAARAVARGTLAREAQDHEVALREAKKKLKRVWWFALPLGR
ncbi:hypothetical protein PRN20_21685 [Devosia sp. ZB163]|nr:hypothetical protein [Devosia sp. ZB163]MDC9826355.1 hypothetical protein [Devosia sp. ZB163]